MQMGEKGSKEEIRGEGLVGLVRLAVRSVSRWRAAALVRLRGRGAPRPPSAVSKPLQGPQQHFRIIPGRENRESAGFVSTSAARNLC